ncbi:hypothetical protein BASA84_001545 [Batrachochytrium salamandrivorans]|nr:hypothetical protein BASA81_015475 [Batrachochytrium salamandrivorans]KAH9265542.1 hypothetical protein BASA84_001545 [Batrachochytrium salamandrivorans]
MFGTGFISPTLFKREERIKDARRESQRNLRDLRRDRDDLERRERQQMIQLKSLVKKGDFPKANLLARQITMYRNLADKNFERGVSIQTEVQVMLSNQRINRAHAESIKGLRYGNSGSTLETVREREQKYGMRMEEYEAIENIMNEGFEDIYENVSLCKDQSRSLEEQIEGVFREVLDPKTKKFDDLGSCALPSPKVSNGRVFLYVKNFNQFLAQGISVATVHLPSLDISCDDLKQYILKDEKALNELLLTKVEDGKETICKFQIGELVKFCGHHQDPLAVEKDINEASTQNFEISNTFYKFVPLSLTQSLESIGITNASVIWICYS